MRCQDIVSAFLFLFLSFVITFSQTFFSVSPLYIKFIAFLGQLALTNIAPRDFDENIVSKKRIFHVEIFRNAAGYICILYILYISFYCVCKITKIRYVTNCVFVNKYICPHFRNGFFLILALSLNKSFWCMQDVLFLHRLP